MRGFLVFAAGLAATLALAARAEAVGGNYVFAGGSDAAREAVRSALEASHFDWSLVPETITIRILDCGCAGARPGEIVLDEQVLTTDRYGPMYAWGIVQHEYAHQVAYFLLDERGRRRVGRWLGGSDWCYEDPGVPHDDHACERFASSLAWAYWPWRRNVMAGQSVVPGSEFRARLQDILASERPARRARRLPTGRSSPTLRHES